MGLVRSSAEPTLGDYLVALWPGLRRLYDHDGVRLIVLLLYYLAIIGAVLLLYGNSTYQPPPFIYQGF